jgi:RimJ/RimL family protein N-acetyltransferase
MTDLQEGVLKGYQVVLRPLVQEDLEQVRQWRNDPAISQFMLSQEMISKEQQQAWFNKIQQDNTQQHFMILYKDKAIGCANIKTRFQGETLLSAEVLEPGLYIADERYRNNILAFSPTLVMNDYCFNQLGVSSLFAVVKAENQAALNYNLKLGYRIDNNGELLEISLQKDDYQHHSAQLKALLSR